MAPPTTTTSDRPFIEVQPKNIFETPFIRQRDNNTIQFADKGKRYDILYLPIELFTNRIQLFKWNATRKSYSTYRIPLNLLYSLGFFSTSHLNTLIHYTPISIDWNVLLFYAGIKYLSNLNEIDMSEQKSQVDSSSKVFEWPSKDESHAESSKFAFSIIFGVKSIGLLAPMASSCHKWAALVCFNCQFC